MLSFLGKYCDVDINECESDKANNCNQTQSTCINTYGSYTCNCTHESCLSHMSDAYYSAAPATSDMQKSNSFQLVRNKNEIVIGVLLAVFIIAVILLATILTLCKLTKSNLHKTPSTTTTSSTENTQKIKLKSYFRRNRNYTNSTNSRNFLLTKSQRNKKKTFAQSRRELHNHNSLISQVLFTIVFRRVARAVDHQKVRQSR
jgi:hypothetical protein